MFSPAFVTDLWISQAWKKGTQLKGQTSVVSTQNRKPSKETHLNCIFKHILTSFFVKNVNNNKLIVFLQQQGDSQQAIRQKLEKYTVGKTYV